MPIDNRRRFRAEPLEPRHLLARVLPDLVAWASESRGYLYDYEIEGDLLRFTTALANRGPGNLELRGGPVLADGTQQLFQRVTNTGGAFEDVAIDGSFTFHPTHDHIHFDGYAIYNLRSVTPDMGVGEIVASGGKISFCLLDVARYSLSAPRSRYATCDEVKQGITTGWSDVYGRHLPDQWINISRVPDGQYWLEVTVDPDDQLLEVDETNNTTRILVDLAGGPANQGDRYEENNSLPTATNLGTVVNRQEPALSIHDANDIDYYRVEARDSGEFEVEIQFTHALGDLDLQLLDATGNVIATSSSGLDGEHLHVDVTAGDTVYFAVLSGNGLANGYEMNLHGPGRQQVVRLASGDVQLPRPIADSPANGTPGVATISVLQGPTLEIEDVNLVIDHLSHSFLADLSIELISPAGTTAKLLSSSRENPSGILRDSNLSDGIVGMVLDDQATVSLAAGREQLTGTFNPSHPSVGSGVLSRFNGENAAGIWQLKIVDWSVRDSGSLEGWSLEFTTSEVGDRFEPNNDFAQAVVLPADEQISHSDLSIHAVNDVDYFRLSTTMAGIVGATAIVDLGDQAIVELYDSSLQLVGTGEVHANSTRLVHPVEEGELYYIRVSGGVNGMNTYGLQVEVRGDINHDSSMSVADIDALFAAIRTGSTDPRYDLNWDGSANAQDMAVMVHTLLGTEFGDANLDHQVDSQDYAIWHDHRFGITTSWADGDFNGDGKVDASDFNLWSRNRFAVGAPAELNDRENLRQPRQAQRLAVATLIGLTRRKRAIDIVFREEAIVLGLCQPDQQHAGSSRLGRVVVEKVLAESFGRRRGRED